LTRLLADFPCELSGSFKMGVRGGFVPFVDFVLGVRDALAHQLEIGSYGGIQRLAMARQISPVLVYRTFTFEQ
jgi:hypothetical protein